MLLFLTSSSKTCNLSLFTRLITAEELNGSGSGSTLSSCSKPRLLEVEEALLVLLPNHPRPVCDNGRDDFVSVLVSAFIPILRCSDVPERFTSYARPLILSDEGVNFCLLYDSRELLFVKYYPQWIQNKNQANYTVLDFSAKHSRAKLRC